MIEDGIEHEKIDISVVTFSKSSEFSHADYGYVVASNFFSSSELVKFFTIVYQVTLRGCLVARKWAEVRK